MRRTSPIVTCGLALLGLALPDASTAGAADAIGPAALASARLDLDGDGKDEEVIVKGGGQVTVLRGGAPVGQAELGPIVSATIEGAGGRAGERAGGPAYLIVRGRGRAGQALLVAHLAPGDPRGGLRVAHAGPVGALGRDGERTLTVSIAGDPPEVRRHQAAPGVLRCDGEGRLFPERYDPAAGWRPDPPPPPSPAKAARLRPQGTAPAGLGPRPLPIYRFVAASAQAGAGGRADLLLPPGELADGSTETAWRVGAGAEGAWVTARASGDHGVRALRIVPAQGQGLRPPRTLAAIFADGSAFLFDLQKGPQWIVLPKLVRSPCVSLSIVATSAGPGEVTGLAEVGVYSEMEGRGARDLVALARGDGVLAEEATAALRALAGADPQAVLGALAEALTGTGPGPGERRLQQVLVAIVPELRAAAHAAQARELLVRCLIALSAAPPEARVSLWEALGRMADLDGAAGLLADAGQPLALRAEAAAYLGRRQDPQGQAASASLLLAALGRQDLQEGLRRALLPALGEALRCRPAEDADVVAARASLERALTSTPPRKEAADLVHALARAGARAGGRCPGAGPGAAGASRAEAAAGWLLGAWQALDASAQDAFGVRYRILQGLALLAAPRGLQLVREVLAERKSDPVLRRAATRAAAALVGPGSGSEGEGARALLRQALLDPDPGVRVEAVLGLSSSGPGAQAGLAALEGAMARDRWPQVRRAATAARAAACPAEAGPKAEAAEVAGVAEVRALRKALRDPDGEVRRLALSGVARCEGAGAFKLLAQVARDREEDPGLRGQSCALLARVSGAAASGVVSQVVLDTLEEPAADERHLGLLQTCLRVLGAVGDAGAVPALLRAMAEPQSAPLRLQGVQALGQLCGRQEGRALFRDRALAGQVAAALQAAGRDADPRVRAAVRVSAARCR